MSTTSDDTVRPTLWQRRPVRLGVIFTVIGVSCWGLLYFVQLVREASRVTDVI